MYVVVQSGKVYDLREVDVKITAKQVQILRGHAWVGYLDRLPIENLDLLSDTPEEAFEKHIVKSERDANLALENLSSARKQVAEAIGLLERWRDNPKPS